MQVRFSLNQLEKYARAETVVWNAVFAVRRIQQIPEGQEFSPVALYQQVFGLKVFAGTFRQDDIEGTLDLGYAWDDHGFWKEDKFYLADLRQCLAAYNAFVGLKIALKDAATGYGAFDFKSVRKAKKWFEHTLDAVEW